MLTLVLFLVVIGSALCGAWTVAIGAGIALWVVDGVLTALGR